MKHKNPDRYTKIAFCLTVTLVAGLVGALSFLGDHAVAYALENSKASFGTSYTTTCLFEGFEDGCRLNPPITTARDINLLGTSHSHIRSHELVGLVSSSSYAAGSEGFVPQLESGSTASSAAQLRLASAEQSSISPANLRAAKATYIVWPTHLDFGTISTYSYADRTFMIKNKGSTKLSGTVQASLPFVVIEDNHFDLDPGQWKHFTIRFLPILPGSSTCMVTLGDSVDTKVICTGKGKPRPFSGILYLEFLASLLAAHDGALIFSSNAFVQADSCKIEERLARYAKACDAAKWIYDARSMYRDDHHTPTTPTWHSDFPTWHNDFPTWGGHSTHQSGSNTSHISIGEMNWTHHVPSAIVAPLPVATPPSWHATIPTAGISSSMSHTSDRRHHISHPRVHH